MSMGGNQIVNMDLLEQQKENIQPMREGRMVSALAQSFSTDLPQLKTKQTQERQEFEKLIEESEELDDPIQVYIDYLQWIENNYPSGSSVESGLVHLLERCTTQFKNASYYKNDPRYLMIWLKYIIYSDNPRDVYVYLAKKEIGKFLATYYEEFAKYLEFNRRKVQADQIYQMGIELKARPLERLIRRYKDFLARCELDPPAQNEPTSHILEHIRTALSMKEGLAPGAFEEGRGTVDIKFDPARPKLQVFNDDKSEKDDIQSIFNKPTTWDNFGTIASRTKENAIAAKPWAGEILKQNQSSSKAISKKFQVFRDDSNMDSSIPAFRIIQNPGKKDEKIELNLDLIYPNENEEYCLDELLAMAKGIYGMKPQVKRKSKSPENLIVKKPLQQREDLTSKMQDHIYQEESTSIVQLKDEGETTGNRPASPTMTMFARQANNEVASMFNQAIESTNDNMNDSETSNYDDYVTETINIKKSKLIEDRLDDTAYMRDLLQSTQMNQEENGSKLPSTPQRMYTNEKKVSPILELTENSTKYTNKQSEAVSTQSSPFIEKPPTDQSFIIDSPTNYYHDNNEEEFQFCNPIDESLRKALISKLDPPIASYPGFFKYNKKSEMNEKFKKVTKNRKIVAMGSKNSIIEFSLTNEIYLIRSELGEGGYATVYLAESGEGYLKALKVENPASTWEFYILKQIQLRLSSHNQNILKSIIRPQSLHFFQDESYLLLNYESQGTILDIVNLFRNFNSTVEEILVVFLAIEIIKIIESLHSVGIMHGDLKPDNCMVRFSSVDDDKWDMEYDKNGNNGWLYKGLTLIDFGRAIDMTLYPKNIKFVSNWKTDQQDCPEMRSKNPWTYEADYYGIASIIHTMLFGKYIEVVEIEGKFKLSSPLKRYWQHDLWVPLFDLLLNPKSYGSLPRHTHLNQQRRKFEDWLELHSTTGKTLKHIIKEVEFQLTEQRKIILSK